LHQTSINKITDIIRESLVEGLGFQVFLTTHNDKTVAYLEKNIKNSKYEAKCFIMEPSSDDGPTKITKYNDSLGQKLLLDNLYLTLLKTGKMSTEQQRQIISNFPEILGSDKSMELLFERHSEEKTEGYLKFINWIYNKKIESENRSNQNRKWEEEHLDIKWVTSLHFEKKKSETSRFENEKYLKNLLVTNEKVTIVWPSDDKNPSFDCLILFAKEYAFFCQITVEKNITNKIKKTFDNHDKYYDSIFKQSV
jgi:hypothetical protein